MIRYYLVSFHFSIILNRQCFALNTSRNLHWYLDIWYLVVKASFIMRYFNSESSFGKAKSCLQVSFSTPYIQWCSTFFFVVAIIFLFLFSLIYCLFLNSCYYQLYYNRYYILYYTKYYIVSLCLLKMKINIYIYLKKCRIVSSSNFDRIYFWWPHKGYNCELLAY